jgi:glycine dehydrogenase subunit 2
MGRVSILATAASQAALEDAGLIDDPVLHSGRMGVAYGSSTGSTDAVADFGNMLINERLDGITATTYIRMMGPDGLRQVSENAVLNANYLKALVSPHYKLAVERTCMHEFVVHGDISGTDVIALDVSKRLIDYGHHPPTNYFPLIVHDALMIEPTETESKQTLDSFAEALVKIKQEALAEPEVLHSAPHVSPVSRLDETAAARHPVLCYKG